MKTSCPKQFRRRVKWWSAKLKVEPSQVRIQKMTRKWASCSTAGWVTFSESLLEESYHFQKQVIVHELLHLQIPNHGKLFKSFMKYYCPSFLHTRIGCSSCIQS